MSIWIKALPLKTAGMAGLLAVVSFRISEWNNIALLVAIFGVVAVFASLTEDDWLDRFQDAVREDSSALAKSANRSYFFSKIWFFNTACFAIILGQIAGAYFAALSLLIMLGVIIYQEIRQIPLLPITIVAATSAAGTLYPVFISPAKESFLLFAATALLIASREIIKDIDDCEVDKGNKWTVPLAIGIKRSKIITGFFICLGLIATVEISLITLISSPVLVFLVFCLFTGKSRKLMKNSIDVGVMVVFITLLIFGS